MDLPGRHDTGACDSTTITSDSSTDEDEDSKRRRTVAGATEGPSGNRINYNSVKEGKKLLEWLLEPFTLEEFLSKNWLRTPKVIKRSRPWFYHHLNLSCDSLDDMLRSNHLQYTKNVDVTSYEAGVRETHNLPGRALPSQVWDFYKNGCSVRWLNPQAYSSSLWLLNATLQEYFSCLVGANVYLTPAGSQGFAPHYDDIEAFVLQLEGRKHWKLYSPRQGEEHPRTSSRNFRPDEVGAPLREVTLEAGDLLYFPRGVIHEAAADASSHSLHVTVSCYQNNTWADLLEEVVPSALRKAIASDPEFRQGLPLGYHEFVGSNSNEAVGEKTLAFTDKVKDLVVRLLDYLPINEGIDKLGRTFMAEALPPCLLSEELAFTVHGSRARVEPSGGPTSDSALNRMNANTKVKLLRRHCLRLVYEDVGPRVYHTADNTCEYREVAPLPLDLSPEMAPAVAALVYAYPRYKRIGDLPMEDDDSKIQLVFDLWEKGLLQTKRPLLPPT